MTKAQRSARRFRRIILVLGIVYTIAAVGWLVLPHLSDFPFDDFMGAGLLGTPLASNLEHEWIHAVVVAVFLGVLLLAQWAFLRPGRVPAAVLASEGRPLKSAVVSAAMMAMLLTVGAIALALEIPGWWEPLVETGSGPFRKKVWVGMLLLWVLWACIFFVYWRQGDRYTQLGKIVRALLAGSLLEALVAIPVHIWAVRQRQCYCERGTYTTLVFSGTVLLWAFGPGIYLLYMREKYRRARLFPICDQCGYDLRGSADRCPECGTPIPVNES